MKPKSYPSPTNSVDHAEKRISLRLDKNGRFPAYPSQQNFHHALKQIRVIPYWKHIPPISIGPTVGAEAGLAHICFRAGILQNP